MPANGNLYGAGKQGAAYRHAAIQSNSVVECVRDRSTGTISFKVDGADHGVAFDQVPDVELHAFCDFYDANSSVLLQDI